MSAAVGPAHTELSVVEQEATFATRTAVFAMIERGQVDGAVASEIALSTSRFDETELWDFKEALPWMLPGVKLSESAKAENDAKVDEIIKDAVAFYNSFGGYIIAGVRDSNRDVIGYDKRFDVDSFNKRLGSVSGQSVACVFRTVEVKQHDLTSVKLGLLFIPRRDSSILPVQLRSDARTAKGNQPCFRRGEFYMRQRDECRPARTPEDYAFLFSDERRRYSVAVPLPKHVVEENLPIRDGELGRFIGREADIANLWQWLSDPFSPVRLICGLGGVGKTSLAYRFAELFILTRPPHFDKVVWLGAKQQNWEASRDRYVKPQRVDFFDVNGFLRRLAVELGCKRCSAALSAGV